GNDDIIPVVIPVKKTTSKPVAKKKLVTRTKTDMIAYLVDHTDLNKNQSNKFFKFFAEVVKESLANGYDVEISDFGLFTTIEMPAKEAMNPQTNEIMLVDAHKQVRFRFADSFKDIFKNLPVDEDEDNIEGQDITDSDSEDITEEEQSSVESVYDETQVIDELVKVEPVIVKHVKHVPSTKVISRTKADIISYLETNTDLNKNKGNKFLKFFAEVIRDSLAKNEDVEIPGFGLFTTIDMPAKEAMNPQTKEIMLVDAHRQVRLRFDEEFKNIFKDIDVLTVTQLTLEIDEKDEEDFEVQEQDDESISIEEDIESVEHKTPIQSTVKKESNPSRSNAEQVLTKTKADMITFLEANTDLNKSKCNKFLKSFAEVIGEALANHDDVDLPGFGLFTTIEMPAKEAMNPQTKKIMLVDAHRQVRLRFADEIKNDMND
ncbi:MAG: HU family DNA-binding protein, partial [Bacilli bacterium]|nr:HU family DNA-binding protein [Bacilli bacterium]